MGVDECRDHVFAEEGVLLEMRPDYLPSAVGRVSQKNATGRHDPVSRSGALHQTTSDESGGEGARLRHVVLEEELEKARHSAYVKVWVAELGGEGVADRWRPSAGECVENVKAPIVAIFDINEGR
jgi:hypothetical protein